MIATILFYVLSVLGAIWCVLQNRTGISKTDSGFRRLAAAGTRWGGWLWL